MKSKIILLAFSALSVPTVCPGQAGRLITLPPLEAKVAAIHSRYDLGDKQALRELATLEPAVAIPLLGQYALNAQWNDPESAQIARETLATFRGHGEFYRQKLADASGPSKEKSGGERLGVFQTLAAIRTKEAVKATAFFLWDETTPEYSGSDYIDASNKSAAVITLAKMHLPGAPTDERSPDGKDADVIKWRAWWTTHQADYQD